MGKTKPTNSTPGIVDFGDTFNKYYNLRYSNATLDKIDDFIEHFEEHCFSNWIGKISPSYNVPETYKNRAKIIAHAKKHFLWHAHIGDPDFKNTPHGKYKVSDWVIHFKRKSNNHILLLELGYHNPMDLPSEDISNGK